MSKKMKTIQSERIEELVFTSMKLEDKPAMKTKVMFFSSFLAKQIKLKLCSLLNKMLMMEWTE